MIEWLLDIPWYGYRLAALALLLFAGLYYQLWFRRRSRIDLTVCTSFFLAGAMLAVHPEVEEAGRFWVTGMFAAEGACLAAGLLLAIAPWTPPLRRRMRARAPLPVLRVSRAVRERVGVGAGTAEKAPEGGTVALYPLRYRYSPRGLALLTWKDDRAADGKKRTEEELHVQMSWN